jgi:protoporphyrinogen oxidase
MAETPVVILGAGPAGIAAALTLGPTALVLERSAEIGGLTCSFEYHGVIFDLGGHSFHTPHPEVRCLVFDSLEMYEQKREARCYASGSLINYPFQKYFNDLTDRRVIDDCIRGLENADGGAKAFDLEHHIYGRFGAGIAEHFLLPYNRRLWGENLQRISDDWVGERIATASVSEESFETGGGKRTPLQNDTTVAYPAKGGFGEITKSLAAKVRNLRLGVSIVRIDPKAKKVFTETGEVISWQRLVSSLPLNKLLAIIDGAPAELRRETDRLEFVPLKLVCAVIGRPIETSIQRVYCAEPQFPAHKIVVANNSSDCLRALPCHGILGEVVHRSGESVHPHMIEARFTSSLVEVGLIDDSREIAATMTTDVHYAYPVPTLDRPEIVARAQYWLEEHGIYTIGRFGEWAYINSDEAMFRGLTLGRRLAGEM